MNQKLQSIIRNIEQTKTKIEELRAQLPEFERKKTELENTEIIKAFRSANVAPEDLTAFVEACKASLTSGAARIEQPTTQTNMMEEQHNDEE